MQQEFETFQSFWEHMRDIVLVLQLDGSIYDVNLSAIAAYGYSKAEFKNLSIQDLRPTDLRIDIPGQMKDAIARGVSFQTQHRRRDGSLFPVDVSSHKMAIGGETYLLSVVRDISDYKKAEAELQNARKALEKANESLERKVAERTAELGKSQGFLRAILDTVMDPIFVKDRQHRWVEGNAAFWDLLGGEDNAKGKTDYDLFPKEQADLFWEGDERVFNGTRFAEEEKLRRPDGTELVIATKKTAFSISDDEMGLVGVIRDITHERQMEAELRRHHDHLVELVDEKTADMQRQRRLYETTLSNTPDLVYMFDLQHRFTYANPALLKMWGRTWAESSGKTCLELGYEPWHAAMHDREIDEVIRTKKPIRGDVPFNGTNGRRIYDYIFSPVIGENGEVEAIAGTTRDVTESREAEQRKDEFLATLAHELRNPLAPIRNALYMMATETGSPEKLAQARALIERQVDQMIRLVDDLMDVSRVTRGKIALRMENILLADVIQNAVDTSAPLVQKNRHTLTIDLPAEAAMIKGDFIRLSQVFTNLLNNAAKYTPNGGRIALRASLSDDSVIIEVSDNGIGVPPEMTARIFEMFSQADTSIERTQDGLGLGLTIVKHLIDLHGGTIEVASAGKDNGSTFTVALPRALHADSSDTQVAEKPQALQAPLLRKALVVDDNAASAQTLGWMMEMMGCEVRVLTSAKEALAAAQDYRPEIVLLDIGMPEISGYDICREMRGMPGLENALFIAQTGWGQKEHLEKSKNAGFHHHLVKPVDMKLLEQILQASASAK